MKQDHNKPIPESFYQTGNTDPGKSHRGIFAILIMVVILLGGIVSVLGFLNVKLLGKVMELSQDDYVFQVTRSDPQTTQPTEPETPREQPQLQLQLDQTPIPATDTLPVQELSLQDIYNRNIQSVVTVTGGAGSTSGTVISECGYILTSYRGLGGRQTVQVLFQDGSSQSALVVSTDPVSDLAILDVDASGLTPVTFCSDDRLQVGDSIVAIGSPLGATLRGTMTQGFISAINRDLQVDGRTLHLFQTNAAAGWGNSGGPLFNCYGQVVGISTWTPGEQLSESTPEGIGFAIPSSSVRDVVDQLLHQGFVSGRAGLGFTVETVTAFDQLYYHVPAGLFITAVEQQELPLQPGDILLRFAGYRVGDAATLQQYLEQHQPGDAVSVTIYRSGMQLEYQITLKEE